MTSVLIAAIAIRPEKESPAPANFFTPAHLSAHQIFGPLRSKMFPAANWNSGPIFTARAAIC